MTLIDLDELQAHCQQVVEWMAVGDVIPFFGAGVNLCDRPPDGSFELGLHLPDAAELAESIAERFKYPWPDRKKLPRVSWHAATTDNGRRALIQHLHRIFNEDYPSTAVHNFFADLPARLREKGYRHARQLIVTTNYDDVLERALAAAGEPYDVVSYVDYSKDPRQIGKFRHYPHGGEPQIILDPTDHDLPITDGVLERTVVLKIHGAVVRGEKPRGNFVITEDDYIDYLARMKPESQLPNVLLDKMQESIFLFLGYSLSDWNLRVLLRSIGVGQAFNDTSWAVMYETEQWDEAYWAKHNVILRMMRLSDYINCLRAQLAALPPAD